MSEREPQFRSPPPKPWPRHWFLRFVKATRLNYRVGGGLRSSIRVAWDDARRGK